MRQKTGKIRILCYGDSNTFGYIADNGGRYDRHTRWTGLLQEFLGEAFQVFEAGMCGRTTAFEDRTEPGRNGLEKVDGAVKAHKPLDLLIFMLGSNDCQVQYQLSAPEIANGMEQVLQKAQKSNSSEAKVLLIAPAAMTERIAGSGFGSNFDAHSVEMSKELAREYEALAKRQECDFLDGTKVTRVSETDGLHLDAQGHKMLAEAVSEWVKKAKMESAGRTGMTTREEVVAFCLTFLDTYEDYPFRDPNWTCMRIRTTNRIFAWIYERQEKIWVNVKCDSQWRDFWRSAYEAVVPAYHMNKEHWNSLILNGTIPQKDIRRMIGESYDLCAKK